MHWVHATLVEASLAAYRRFVGQLTPEKEEAYYGEMALVASVFELSRATAPATLADFRDYLEAQLAGPEICVTPPAGHVAAVILVRRCRRRSAPSCAVSTASIERCTRSGAASAPLRG